MPELPPGPRAPRVFQMFQEMKIVLARVLSRVALRLDPRHPVRVVRRGITFAPSGGVRVIRAAD